MLALVFALLLNAPLADSQHAIPLGNGLEGGLLWGGGNHINLSLDRGDLWDLRRPQIYSQPDWTYTSLVSWVRAGNEKKIHEYFDIPYDDIAYPTKLGAGRLEITFPDGTQAREFTLDLTRAQGSVVLSDARMDAFFSANEPVALVRIIGPEPRLQLRPPSGVDKLGYAAATRGESALNGTQTLWMLQQAALGLSYAVAVSSHRSGNVTTIAIAIERSTESADDPSARAQERTQQALRRGYTALFASHERWWQHFSQTSHVNVPDAAIQQQYDLDKYYFGSGSRVGAPPMPLQGVWTADNGRLPPWKGDFHNDLNTQMTYLPYAEAGLFEAGRSFLDFNWQLLPEFRRFATSYYGVAGAVVPGVMSLDGKPLGGWAQYSLSPIQGAWVAQSFYTHWRYTMDRAFLRDRAYPFMREIGQSLRALMQPGADGELHLPFSSSPEIFDNSMRAWLPPSSNYDVELERALFSELEEMATAQGLTGSARTWADVLEHLPSLNVVGNILQLAPGVRLEESHRHLSQLMAIYPLAQLDPHASAANRALDNASIDDFTSRGRDGWEGYTLTWLACAYAYMGRANPARSYLDDFVRDYTNPNGFHINGYHGGPFTLEGNMLAMQAVQEMLLQSENGVVRIFPAVPDDWRDVSFDGLRAMGGYIVSARRSGGETTHVRIVATATGTLHMQDPFQSSYATWNRPVHRTGDEITVVLRAGDALQSL